MRVLYGSPHNRAFRCYWMLEELGLEYEARPLDTRAGECRTESFLAINPNGKVPVSRRFSAREMGKPCIEQMGFCS